MLTVTQAAHAVGRDTSTIRNLILKGKLPATVGRGGRKYIDPADLERAFPGWAAPRPDVDVVASAIADTQAERATLLATIVTVLAEQATTHELRTIAEAVNEMAEHAATHELRTIAKAMTAGRAAMAQALAAPLRPLS